MGTSKGYIAPTRPEWSASKRSVSSFLRHHDTDSKAKAVSKFAEAMSTGSSSSQAFSSAAGNVLSFAKGISTNGLNDTLLLFGRDDLIGKEPDEILVYRYLRSITAVHKCRMLFLCKCKHDFR